MSLEQRVRSTLIDAGSRIDAGTQPAIKESWVTVPKRPRRSRPMLAFVAGFVGVAFFVIVAMIVSGNRALDTPIQNFALLDPDDSGVLQWTAEDELPEDHVVHAIADGPSGWLALASRFINAAPGEYLFLQSADGVNWTTVDASIPGAVTVDEIVGSENGYFAYGLFAGEDYQVTTTDQPSNFPTPAVWTSVDGTSWEVTPLPLPPPEEAISEIVSYRPFHLAEGEGRVVVLGVEFDEVVPDDFEGSYAVPTRPITWESTALGEWRLLTPENADDWSDLAAGPAGIIAVGGTENEVKIVTWSDGIWEQSSTFEGSGFQARLVGNEDGYLLGTTGGLFLSTDAETWIPVDGPANGAVLAAHSGGFTVLEGGPGSTTVWWSPEGTSWSIVGTEDELGTDLSFMGAAASEDSVAIFGQTIASTIEDTRGFLTVLTNQP